jgi:hypothetical protein
VSELEPIPPERQALATRRTQMDREIREIKRQMESLWVLLAERLYHFRVGEMWKDIGYPTLQSWLDDPEVDVERRWLYKLTDAYRFLVIEWGVPLERVKRLKISKVNEVLPAIRRGQVELEAGLSDAETLRRDDLEVQYRGLHSSMPGSAVAATSPMIETDRSTNLDAARSTSADRRHHEEESKMGYVPNLRLVVPEASEMTAREEKAARVRALREGATPGGRSARGSGSPSRMRMASIPTRPASATGSASAVTSALRRLRHDDQPERDARRTWCAAVTAGSRTGKSDPPVGHRQCRRVGAAVRGAAGGDRLESYACAGDRRAVEGQSRRVHGPAVAAAADRYQPFRLVERDAPRARPPAARAVGVPIGRRGVALRDEDRA